MKYYLHLIGLQSSSSQGAIFLIAVLTEYLLRSVCTVLYESDRDNKQPGVAKSPRQLSFENSTTVVAFFWSEVSNRIESNQSFHCIISYRKRVRGKAVFGLDRFRLPIYHIIL